MYVCVKLSNSSATDKSLKRITFKGRTIRRWYVRERVFMWQLYQMPSHCETIPPEEKWIEYRCREGAGEELEEEGENKMKTESEKKGVSHWKIYNG